MLKISYLSLLLGLLLPNIAAADTQLSIGIGTPYVHIGVNVSSYPDLVVVPGYPVYYAPRLQANLFFYDGLYWIYDHDDWYASAWYDGPWDYVSSAEVPLYILRVPVRYYRVPPVYFHGWRQDAPPQWGRHWGRDWEQRRSGWDRWDRRSNPQPAPRPAYQQQYSGERYPRQLEQQQALRQKNYQYQARDPEVRQHDASSAERGADDNRNLRNTPEMRRDSQAPDVRAEPGTARANGGRQWDMPRDSQQQAPSADEANTRRSQPRQRGDAAMDRRDSPQSERANGRDDRQPRSSQPRQQSAAEERQSRQQGRDGGGESRREQDSGRGRGRNE